MPDGLSDANRVSAVCGSLHQSFRTVTGRPVPFVDTLLFLRPTSSATVFLQQMGRGLRLSPDKPSCLILDFVGQHRREFRFDSVLSAVTGIPRGRLTREVEADFPTLPAGCVIQLDRVAKARILHSLRQALGGGEQRLAEELRAAGLLRLVAFLEHSGRSLQQVYGAGGITHLRRLAGQLPASVDTDETDVNRRFERLLHIDDPARLKVIRSPASVPPVEQLMLGYQLFHEGAERFEPAEWLTRLSPPLLSELGELADALAPGAHAIESARLVPEWPLHFHRRYGRREVLTGCGYWTPQRKASHREGPLRLSDLKVELLFVTLDKSQGGFSATTSYRDYALGRDLFHWETQNAAAPHTQAGRRYIEQERNGWRFVLFVRETREDAFVALGPARYVSHTGERPMGITWKLETPMTAALFERFAALLPA
jgi:hypothetical protein